VLLAAALATSPFVEKAGTSLDGGHLSRTEIYANTLKGIEEQVIVGAGLGAFQQVYPRFEDPDVVYPTYDNHAHNDYLEITFEAGLAGVALVVGLIVWWLAQAVGVWRGPLNEEGRLRAAAVIATAVVLLHSLVDYPLRTTAIASVAAFCLAAMIAERRRKTRQEPPAPEEEGADARNIVL
jgi:O-antigen ligase